MRVLPHEPSVQNGKRYPKATVDVLGREQGLSSWTRRAAWSDKPVLLSPSGKRMVVEDSDRAA